MHSSDQSRQVLEKFPEIDSKSSFSFACRPGISCFNACCSNLDLNLTPYDVLCLRSHLDLGSRSFLERYGKIVCAPDTAVPGVRLTMMQDYERSCPFVTPAGCSVYPHRPGACRTYPVGRATSMTSDGLQEKFFLIKEPHCAGFKEEQAWTPHTWLADQGLEPYNASNDRYMRLMSLLRQKGMSIPPNKIGMAVMALYHVDEFKSFLTEMKILEKLPLASGSAADILQNEEKTLDFAFKWLDIIVLGFDPNIVLSN